MGYVLVHPDTAKPLGIAHGDTVRIKTATGSVEAVAELTASIRPGIIFTPSHFTGTSPHAATRSKPINAILPNYWDRVSAQFNGVGCTLEKA
ncbi:MAG: molybdopterin dinucleotide binding domain-containing protein [Bilophila wadsworthia]